MCKVQKAIEDRVYARREELRKKVGADVTAAAAAA